MRKETGEETRATQRPYKNMLQPGLQKTRYETSSLTANYSDTFSGTSPKTVVLWLVSISQEMQSKVS